MGNCERLCAISRGLDSQPRRIRRRPCRCAEETFSRVPAWPARKNELIQNRLRRIAAERNQRWDVARSTWFTGTGFTRERDRHDFVCSLVRSGDSRLALDSVAYCHSFLADRAREVLSYAEFTRYRKRRRQSGSPIRQGRTDARRNDDSEGDRSQKITRRSYKRCRQPKARSTPAMESRTQVADSRLESTSPFQGKETSPASDDAMDHASPS